MFIQKRLLSLFELLNQDDVKISCKRLSEKLKVTERTIRNDITSINSILKKHGAIIKIKRSEGYYIDIFDLNLYQEYLAKNSEEIMDSNELPDSPIERNKYILKHILYNNDYIKVEELADILYVSKVTILNDIKRIKTILSKYNLTLISKPYHGLKISGKELDIRHCISDNIINRDFENYIMGFTEDEKELFKNINLDELQEVVLNEVNKSNVEFSDFNFKNFMIHLAIAINRILLDYKLESTKNIPYYGFDINDSLENIFNYLENKYNIIISKADKFYIYNHYNTKSKSLIDNIDIRIVNYTKELLKIIYDTYNFDLRDDEILYHDLLLHFKSILNSKYYNLNKVNPLINTIKSNYPLAFEITFTSIEKVFKNSIYSFNEDEVGYVSLHIGAAIERFFQNNINPKNTVIVCGSGYGTSRLLEAQINKVFHDKLNIIECLSFNQFKLKKFTDIDLIISTIPLNHDTIPIVLVDFTLLNKDIQNISKAITNKSVISSKILDEYFDPKLFLKSPNVKIKNDLLNLMCDILNENEIVFPSFTDSILYRETLSPTNLDNFLAIPHPMELSSTKTKVCVAILDEPIFWNEEVSVKVVMMLAINKNDYFDIDSVYSILIKIINDDDIKHKLSLCNNFEEFISIIKSLIL